MNRATAPNGSETHIRAIVFKEGDFFVAQCLEYDISKRGKFPGKAFSLGRG